jgi:glycosyltransferase involved in cell wall biosynthesis
LECRLIGLKAGPSLFNAIQTHSMPSSLVRPLRIALLGTRGIPARYGGFETFAEELSKRLVKRGHSVSVYSRHAFGSLRPENKVLDGVTVISTPTIMHKYLETPLHALSSFIDLFSRTHDVALLCNAANAPFAWLVRLRGLPLLINVDGIERERGKWNSLGKAWYYLGERCAAWFGSRIVADAEVVAAYYRQQYHIEPEIITYGAEARRLPPGAMLQQFGLQPDNYILYVSRLEPENNALGVIQAYLDAKIEIPLVIVGDAPYATEYKAGLRRLAATGNGVVFTGFQFGESYQELRTNCRLYIQATEVGGTHPALVEAMAYGNAIIANQVPEHAEVLGSAGLYYSKNNFLELSQIIKKIIGDEKRLAELRTMAAARASVLYNWDRITEQYEQLFSNLLRLT